VRATLPARPAETAIRDATIPRMRAEDAAVVRLLQRLRERTGSFDLELLLLRGTDPVSHYFWRFYEPGAAAYAGQPDPSSDERSRYGSAVEDHYRSLTACWGSCPPSVRRIMRFSCCRITASKPASTGS
jgi:hypothetical protein